MSKTGVIVALLVALVLAAAALLLGGKGRGFQAAVGPLLSFDPARVVELRVTRADGQADAVNRASQPGSWEVAQPGRGTAHTWAADGGRMRGALRILSTLEPVQDAEPGAKVEPGAAELTVTIEGAKKWTMRISSRMVGGNVLVEASGPGSAPRVALVKAEIRDMLVGAGPREWRSRAALPGLNPDVARITLKGRQEEVFLARVQGRWGLREPVQEAAEPDAVVKLLTALGCIQIADFLDEEAPNQTGLDAPIAELSIEFDERDADGKSVTWRNTLRVGRQADISGKTVFASVDCGDGGQPRIVKVGADSLAALSTDPTRYIALRSIQTPAPDVGGITISPATGPARRYTRDLVGWTAAGEGGVTTAVGKADADGIGALLTLLTQTPCDAIALGDKWPAPVWGHDSIGQSIASLELATAGGTQVGHAEIVMAALPGKPAKPSVVIHVGSVWRAYDAGAAAQALAWLARS